LVDDETSSNKKKNPVNLSQLPSPTDATFKNVTFEKNNISTPKTTSTQGGSFTTYELAYYDYASSTITISSTNTQTAQTTNTLVFNAGDALKVATDLDKLKQNYFLDNNPKKEIGIIENIYISLDFLYKQALSSGLESQDSKEKNEINLYNYIKSIASAINTALGSVNNFEVHVDPVDNIARIIDVNYCEPDKKKIDLFELQVHNLNSVVRSYSLQSKIFPNQSAIIAIGSQAQGGELGQQNNTMIDWNTGLVDRILPKKTFPINENALSSNKDDLKMANSLSSIVLLLADLNREPASGQSTIMDDISKAKNALRDLIIYFQSIVASPGANRNLIPTKFSFEMDGIGGLVIGHLFKINDDILPRGYKYTKNSSSILAQTVTSISHAIGNGDWSTTIDALNIILDDIAGEFYTLDIKGIVNRAVEVAIKEAITPTSGAGGSGAGTGGRAPISNNAIATFGKVDNTVPIHGKVILDMLSCTEGTATAGQSGYDILFNFRIIQGWTPDTTAGHPNIAIPFGKTSTTAGGRYGFLYDVWVETNGGKNAAFTKTNQDNAGWKLVKQKISGDENTAEQAYNTAISGVTDVSSNPSFIKMLGLKVAKGQSGYGVGLSYGWASVCDQNGAYIYANQSSDRGTQDMYNIYLQAIKSNGGNTGSPSSSSSTAIVIGDSQTPFIAKQSNAQVEPSLFEGGKNLGWLFNAVKSYKVDTNIKHVIISIGTNGNFNANDKIEGLMALLKARFPNAKFAVVGGSWGWGGNTLSNEGHLAMTYYNRFIAEGVTFVGYIGKTQDPHKDLPEYKTIGNKINTFIST
jgi:muramidase (phage lysozyme)